MKKRFASIALVAAVVYLGVAFVMLPEYKEYNSLVFSSGNTIETELNLIVYKARYNPILYDDIARKNNMLNGKPTKLTMNLYRSEWSIKQGHAPYRIVVYEYDRNLKYILLK